jgi:hypothetical protein
MDDQWFWIIICWAVIIGVWLWSRKIEREVKEVEKDVHTLLNKILFMRVEKHDDKMFAYDAMTDEFICQGISLEDLNKNFGIRFPNRRGILVEAEETPNVL